MIRENCDTFMLLRRMRVPCPLSEINVFEMGMTIKNMEKTSQAGTLCCTADGIVT